MKMCWKIICRAVSLKIIIRFGMWNIFSWFRVNAAARALHSSKLPSPLWLCGLGCTYNKGTISKSWWETAITLERRSLPWGDRCVRYKSQFPCKKMLPFCFTLSKIDLLLWEIFLLWKFQFPQSIFRRISIQLHQDENVHLVSQCV